jgi:hypothetical protein
MANVMETVTESREAFVSNPALRVIWEIEGHTVIRGAPEPPNFLKVGAGMGFKPNGARQYSWIAEDGKRSYTDDGKRYISYSEWPTRPANW